MTRRPLPLPAQTTPLPRLSRRAVKAVLEATDVELRWAWSLVRTLKHPETLNDDFGPDLLEFQPRLVEAIVRLEAFAHAVRAEQKRLKRDQKRYVKSWLKHRQSLLGLYLTALTTSLASARAVGDGFAWFFHEKDRRLIGEHLKHPRLADVPLGIGGLGERLLVHGLPHLDGRILIYHGTTTFLRIGDATLIDLPSRRVHAIAELKTRKIKDGEYGLTLHFIADAQDKLPRTPKIRKRVRAEAEATEPELKPELQERLDAQLKRMGLALKDARAEKAAVHFGKQGEFHFAELSDAVRRATTLRFTLVQAGPALVIGALRHRGWGSFNADLKGSRDLSHGLLNGIADRVIGIMAPGRPDNAVFIDAPGSGDTLPVTRQGLPPAWWPMDDEALADILFGRVMVVTFYNPAHLRLAMETRGLFPTDMPDLLRGTLEGRRVELSAIRHFDWMIQHNFMSLDSVVAMLDETLKSAVEQSAEGGVRIEINAQVTTGAAAHEGDEDGGIPTTDSCSSRLGRRHPKRSS